MPEFSSSSSTSSAPAEAQPSSRRFALDAAPLFCSIGSDGSSLAIAVQDEAGKVDLNMEQRTAAARRCLGLGIGAAGAKVDAILDFRDEDDDRRADGAERADTGLPADRSVPATVLPAIEELAGVLGVAQADADRLRPFVTIYSGLPAIDANVAPQALIDIVARGSDQAGGSRPFGGIAMGMGRKGPDAPLSAQLLAASTRRAFSVHSGAHAGRSKVRARGGGGVRGVDAWRLRGSPVAPWQRHARAIARRRAFRPASARGAPPERRPATACGTPWPLPPGCAPAASA